MWTKLRTAGFVPQNAARFRARDRSRFSCRSKSGTGSRVFSAPLVEPRVSRLRARRYGVASTKFEERSRARPGVGVSAPM